MIVKELKNLQASGESRNKVDQAGSLWMFAWLPS